MRAWGYEGVVGVGNSALEFAVLSHLEGAELVLAELARRSGMAESAVQAVLDPLVARGFVARELQGAEPPTFRLTMTGVKRLRSHRGYSEARAVQEWRGEPREVPQVPKKEPLFTWTWAGETPPPRPGNPALEQALVEQLEHTALTHAELVRRTGAPANDVQAALDKLIDETFVIRVEQDDRAIEYDLTEGGMGRLKLVRELAESPMTVLGKVLGAAATQAVRGHSDLAPVVRASREQVSEGKPTPGRRSGAAGCTSIVSVFFGLIGLALVTGHKDVDDVVFGLVLIVGAVVWNYLVWSWARRRVN
ncbi:MarR family transcriptional regulator [Kribbella sp. NPDC005582]|uniref:MarR family transcriptional regulator n=1 Tax=Kribbella sp. NPDC005582 TaxID=3156893 RepID=UPI0033B1F8E3